MGLKTELVEDICRQAGDVFVSNINSATQTVISGWRDDMLAACLMASEAGALGVKELPILFPLHSPLMQGIGSIISPFLASIEISEPAIPLLSHLDGRPLDAEGIADVLREQLTRKVLWRDAVRAIRQKGISRFVEIGPSDVLSKLVRWIERDAESFRAEELLSCQPK
jgi:[acyl-carrier-protein] S-malonyltransferase